VYAIRGLVEALSNAVDFFFSTFDLHPDGTFEDIADHRAGMTVWFRLFPGAIVDLNEVGGKVVAVELRQGLGDYVSGVCSRRLCLDGFMRPPNHSRLSVNGGIHDESEDIGPTVETSHVVFSLAVWQG
jgi:hypothetical protein